MRCASLLLSRSPAPVRPRHLPLSVAPPPRAAQVLVFFPDPWRGSNERRILRAAVIGQVRLRLRPGGLLRIGTDVAGYPAEARAVIAADSPAWVEVDCKECEACRPGHERPDTHYAREAVREGREIHDLCFLYNRAAL